MAAVRGDLWNRSSLVCGGVKRQEKFFSQPMVAGWLCFNMNKKYIFLWRLWNPQAKRKKSDGWISNSSEASRDCSDTSYIILSICIVHLEQQHSCCFKIKNNLEGANKLTVYQIVERRENLYLAIIDTCVRLLIEPAQPSSGMWQWQLNSSSRLMDLIVLQQ